MNAKEIKDMDKIERLRLMEALWNSFLEEDEDIEAPEWHGEILRSRMQKISRGEAEFVSLEDYKARLKP